MTDHTLIKQHLRQAERGSLGDLASAIETARAGLETAETYATATATQDITEAGAITLPAAAMTHVRITGPASSTYAVTLAAPTAAYAGRVLIIEMIATTATNAVTLALTNVQGGSAASSASFNAANETLILVAGTAKWNVVAEAGVTLS